MQHPYGNKQLSASQRGRLEQSERWLQQEGAGVGAAVWHKAARNYVLLGKGCVAKILSNVERWEAYHALSDEDKALARLAKKKYAAIWIELVGLPSEAEDFCDEDGIYYWELTEEEYFPPSPAQLRRLLAERRKRARWFDAHAADAPWTFRDRARRQFLVAEEPSREELEARGDRECCLTAALAARGCELRSDSVLSKNYITYGTGSSDAIAKTMEEMAFLYDETDYEARMERIVDDAVDEMRQDPDERCYIGEDLPAIRQEASRQAKEEVAAVYRKRRNRGTLTEEEYAELPSAFRRRIRRRG